jgi:trehalose-phosphatase
MDNVISRARFEAVIFDLDGVVTRTAGLHLRAWKKLFDAFLRQRAAASAAGFTPFTEEDYRRFVDGKPRHEGVRGFLASRGISLPLGEPNGPPEPETITSLGKRKNELFQEELERRGPEVFDSSLRLIRDLRGLGFKIGLVSSSRNLVPVINAAGITDYFDVRVDGVDIDTLNLPGKPAPDAFQLAARELGVEAARTVVVEDSQAGVEAGRRGRFGLVIGVARHGDQEDLRRAGADIVVADLAEIGIESEPPLPVTSTAELESVLSRFGEITAMLSQRRPAVFLDYDGTLTPIVRHPREAVLGQGLRGILERLARLVPVAVVSGRDLADIRAMVGLGNIYYAGSHGFDIAGPAGESLTLEKGAEYLGVLGQAGQELDKKLAGLPGVRLERKKFALAVHFREADAQTAAGLAPLIDEIRAGNPGLRKSGGKKIIELRPDIDWDKGRAISWLLQRLGLDGPDVLPLYLGDDLTDEDAFRALRDNGLGIVVRDGDARPTAARYALDEPEQVGEFLERLARWLEGGRQEAD